MGSNSLLLNVNDPSPKKQNIVRFYLYIAGADPGFLERGFINIKVRGFAPGGGGGGYSNFFPHT